jgi:hypothetical protein
MTMRLIPHAEVMSEFLGQWNGDCGETAEICALHVINPTRYTLDPAELARVVRRGIDHGWASANGAEPLSGIESDLALEGVKHTSYGFSNPARFDWRGVLRQWGGVKPLIVEIAQAGKLPGDEPGVHFHFIACLGWDPDTNTGVFADGDNIAVRHGRSGPTGLVRYTLANLEAAQICGLIVAEYVLGETPVMTPTITIPTSWKDDGATLTAPNGVAVVRGFRDYILAHPTWVASNWPLAPESSVSQLEMSNPALGGGSQQFFRGTVLEWRPASAGGDGGPTGVFQMPIGQELTTARAALSASASQLSAANATITSQRQQLTTLQQQTTDQQQQIAALQQQIAALQTPAPAVPSAPADPTAPEPATPTMPATPQAGS